MRVLMLAQVAGAMAGAMVGGVLDVTPLGSEPSPAGAGVTWGAWATAGGEQLGLLLPSLQAHPAVVGFVQSSLLLLGGALSLALHRKLARAPWLTLAPQGALLAAAVAELWLLNIDFVPEPL